MIQNVLKLIPLDKIKVVEELRQRSSEKPSAANCFEFALALAGPNSPGLLQNIGVTDNMELVFGERRLTAFKLLNTGSPELSSDQNAALAAAAAANPLYNKWSTIPARILKNTNNIALSCSQFLENVNRSDLPLNDRQRAAWEVHKSCVEAARARNATLGPGIAPERWTDAQTAALLGITPQYFSMLTKPLRDIENAPKALQPKLREVISGATSTIAAANAVKAVLERHGESAGVQLDLSAATTVLRRRPTDQPQLEVPILCADFTKWAPTYTGEPFNFLHMDLPYGIEFNDSSAMSTSAATAQIGTYDDSPEVYWKLLKTLVENRDRLVAPSAHILFWFSQNWRRETEDFFTREWPEAVVSKFLLVWYCSDNSGLMPTPREGRRNYETALQITIGDRPLASQKSMVFSYPRNSDTKVHRSVKHLAVLEHFMSQYVDESSRVLDPTCGSGTSLIVARRLGAKHLLGLELDPEMREAAAKFYVESTQ
jgi:hypothetical protein